MLSVCSVCFASSHGQKDLSLFIASDKIAGKKKPDSGREHFLFLVSELCVEIWAALVLTNVLGYGVEHARNGPCPTNRALLPKIAFTDCFLQ